VRIRDVFAYRLRVLEAVTANAAMPLVAGEDVRTPLGAFRVAFGRGQDHMLGIPVGGLTSAAKLDSGVIVRALSALRDESASAASSTALRLLGATTGLSSPPPDRIQT